MKKEIWNFRRFLLYLGFILQIISLNGLLNYYLLQKIGLGSFKKIIFPIGIVITLVAIFFKKNREKLSKIDLIFILLMVTSFVVIMVNVDNMEDIYFAFREVWLFFILVLLYQKIRFNDELIDVLALILILYSVINISAILVNYIIGFEKYMVFFTGRYIYPMDKELGFKISTFGNLIRSPGLIGESAQIGFFALNSFFISKVSKYKKLSFIPFILIIISLTRSVYVVVVVYYLIKQRKAILNAYVLIISACIIPIGIIKINEQNSKFFSIESLLERLKFWTEIKLDTNFLNVLIGGNIGKLGAAADDGFIRIFDNYWLFMFYNIGIVGIIVVICFIFKHFNTKELRIIIIGIIVSGLFVNLFQAIPNIVLLSLIPAIYKYKGEKDENSYRIEPV